MDLRSSIVAPILGLSLASCGSSYEHKYYSVPTYYGVAYYHTLTDSDGNFLSGERFEDSFDNGTLNGYCNRDLNGGVFCTYLLGADGVTGAYCDVPCSVIDQNDPFAFILKQRFEEVRARALEEENKEIDLENEKLELV